MVELVAEDGLRQGLQEDEQYLSNRVVTTNCRKHVEKEHSMHYLVGFFLTLNL